MNIVFLSLFQRQYEGGANWLETTLLSLGTLPTPPTCIVLGASRESLPESLSSAEYVRAAPLISRSFEFDAGNAIRRMLRRVENHLSARAAVSRAAAGSNIDLWVGFGLFPDLRRDCSLVCFPDFQFRYLPQFNNSAETRALEARWSYAVKYAEGIVMLSEAAQRDALELHPEVKPKLYVCGFPPVFTMENLTLTPGETREKYSLPKRFFLVCNQFWTHKNHLVVMRALDLIRQRGRKPPVVVFTGRPYDHRQPDAFSEILQFVHEHNLHECCRFFGVLPRKEQTALIRAAEAVIQPSKFEGRGAISEETCLLGTQLLCSDIPPHRELSLPNAIFFEPDDVANLSLLMECSYPHSARDSYSIYQESLRLARAYGDRFLEICERVIGNGKAI